MTESFYGVLDPSLGEVVEALMYKKSRKVTKLIKKLSKNKKFFKVNVDLLFGELKLRKADRTLNRLGCVMRDFK